MPNKFVLYLIFDRRLTDNKVGVCYVDATNLCSIHNPSESILMIPPIGWDCE